ncbi:Tc toxin subunit A [Pseudomonas sp. GL-R-19]|uniref:Tc toxin subunit A n=1 Tax=Pseudomonas sp. GL-R-19 TaxID=2832391 RepID=UPI001CBD586D|nr:Tc toxin subunit A [Pseudomonas sp. GL-R-19]
MSKDYFNSPLKQLFELAPGTLDHSVQVNYERFINEGGSVFELLKMGREGVVQTFTLSSDEAQALLDKAKSLAVHSAREYREQRLVRKGPPNPLHRTGIRALVDTPSFDDLFNPDWEAAAPAQSLDSSISPAAYFLRLVELARALEERAVKKKFTFEARRPDLTSLIIDPTSAFQIKPTITLVNEVLESIIKNHLAPQLLEGQVVDDKLLETRFPHRSMPFEWYAEQYKVVLAKNKLSLGEVVRSIDHTAPYFRRPGVRGDFSDIALRQSCNLGPQQQRLLIENFVIPGNAAVFYTKNFGSTADKLKDSVHFCAQTSIDAKALTSLLSIEEFVPKQSSNVSLPTTTATVTPKEFGSRYINYGLAAAMDLSDPADGTRQFVRHDLNRFDRMNRMLRLSRWLDLPPDQCDRLIMAAFNAEVRGDFVDPATRLKELADRPSRITNNTLRVIGLFQEFRLQFKCTAEQFAALIDEISPCGRGEELSQFDRIFNVQALFDAPLKLDNRFFAIEPQTRNDKRTVDQICSSLGLNQETWLYLARFVAKSYNQRDELQCSLSVVSSFYRLVLLASFLRINPIELAALLETLSERGASEVVQRLLGEPRLLISGTGGVGDVLSVIHAAQTCVQWLQENDLTVTWLVQHVAQVIAPPMATEADVMLLQEIHGRLQPVRLTEEVFTAAGVPQNNAVPSRGWLSLLDQLVDADGLVSNLPSDENDYERAVAEIQAAVADAKLPEADVDNARAVILALVLQARDAQCAVIQESLSVYLSVSPDVVLPLLKWVNKGGVYLLVMETTRALAAVTSGADKINVGDDVLNLLEHLVQRAEVVNKLSLSSAMLVALTTRRNWQWFGLNDAQALTLSTLYQLTLFQRAVMHTGQPAQTLLQYLELVNALPAMLTPEDQRLIRDSAATRLAVVLKWGVREVLECILYLSPAMPIVRDVTTLDALLRIRGLATRSGLDAKAIIRLGSLTPDSDTPAYRDVAEHVLESLSESTVEGQSREIGEIGQSVTHEIRCINDTLIANAENQVALVELCLRDLANRPMPNITVRWTSDRPGLLEDISITDHEGRAVIRFRPEKGTWMGAVQIKGSYGLAQVVYAPKIIVDCDEFSLGFDLGGTTDPEPDETFLAGGEGIFPVWVRLVDEHSNPGVGRTVTFSGQGVVADPLVAITDAEGIARTRVRSIEPVEEASLVASYSTKDSKVINNITFVDKPSITLLEVVSMAVDGEPLVLRCHVFGLGRLPSPGVSVGLYLDAAEEPIETKLTTEEGIAEFTVPDVKAGKQTFTAKVEMDEQQLEIDVARSAVIHGESADYRFPVAGSGTPTLLWVTVREESHNQSRFIANCPILWSVAGPGGEPLASVSIPTDAIGRSTYPFEVDVAGKYDVTAVREAGAEDQRIFDLQVVPAIDWTFTLTDTTTSIPDSSVPLAFIRGHQYKLVINLPDGVDLEGARAMLAWDSDFSAKGMGMLFTPATGAYVAIGANGTSLSWDISCQNLRNGAFDLTFYCDRLDQRLILPGRLDAPPPVVAIPAQNAEVDVQPELSGTGSSSAQIYVFEGKQGALLARTSVGADGNWKVTIAEPLSTGPHVFSVKQRHIDTTEAWAPDVHVHVGKKSLINP